MARRLYSMDSAVVGGTFNFLHIGHEKLLRLASGFGEVCIGLATDAFARKMKIRPCQPFSVRKASLLAFLKKEKMQGKCDIVPIADAFGPSTSDESPGTIIVSEETAPMAKKINAIRKKKGMRALKIISVPLARAEDGIKISSSRIASGKISREGKRLAKIVFAIGSENPVKLSGAKAAFSRAFGRSRITLLHTKISGHAPEQPIGAAQTMGGAQARAVAAYKKFVPRCDYGVGLESGLIPFGDDFFDIQFCCLFDGSGFSWGCSMGFPLPNKIMREVVLHSSPMGEAVSKLSGIKSIGRKGGAIHFLSRGLLHRREMVEQAALCALVERRSPI